ncbi:MAG: AAA family ATPase [Bacteroidia bacterium]
MHIQKLEIENIRCIEKLTMQFPENPAGWHVLIGENGSGKSTILKAMAATLLKTANHITPIWNSWLRKDAQEGNIILAIQKSDDDRNSDAANTPTFNTHLKIKKNQPSEKERDITKYGGNGWFSMSFGVNRSFSSEDKDTENHHTNAHLSLLEEEYRFSKITSWLKNLYQRNGKLGWIKTILNTELLPNGITFVGVKEVENSDDLKVVFEKEEQELGLMDLSDGYRSVLILTLEIIRQVKHFFPDDNYVFGNIKKGEMNFPISGVILIDEIDAHLHPTWQVKIGEWFTKYFPNIQFIVTTHSPLICRAIGEKGTIWKVENGGAREITGIEKLRLRYGNILEAYDTFGGALSTSKEAKKLRNRLAQLNIRSIQGKITSEEEAEREDLRTFFPTKYDTVAE